VLEEVTAVVVFPTPEAVEGALIEVFSLAGQVDLVLFF